ncbi:MFS transporter [Cyanobium sp. CH-040]|uniref:MFS transporter n=1 Tax=Cyanobium sp. CH-040 TaxID=2823708 RepID=UPI0020CE8830|nr:MFS transporter [Cyanobium sp. CH-040]MCP9927051.1 MFS transporter [Cyanobium sp. CH-040]
MTASRRAAFLCAFLTLLNDRLSETLIFPLLPFLLAGFTGDGRVLGLLTGSYAFAQFAATPLIGALSDRFGRRPVISVCVAGSVLGLGLFALTIATDWSALPWAAGSALPLSLLFAARLIDGVSGGTAATAGAVLADVSPPEQRARAFGLIGVAFGLGFILGPALGGLLGRVHVNLPLLVAVAIAVLNLTLVVTLLPETHPIEARIPLPRKRELQPFTQLARVFVNPQVRRLCASFFLFFLAFNGFAAVLILYLKQQFGWGPGLAGAAFVVVGVVAMVVQGGLIGPLVAHFGEWRLTMAGIGFVIGGGLLILLATAETSRALIFPAVSLLALGTGLVTPCLRAQVSRRLDDSGQGAALGSLQGLQSLGSFIGPALAGLAYETLGRTSPFWLGLGLLLGVAAIVAGGARRMGAVKQTRHRPGRP